MKTLRGPARTAALTVGGLVLLLLIILIGRACSSSGVEITVLRSDPLGYDDGSWDHFEALAVPRKTTRAQLQDLLEDLRKKYAASDYDRVKIVIFNDNFALLHAKDSALVAEYRQDRKASQFDLELIE